MTRIAFASGIGAASGTRSAIGIVISVTVLGAWLRLNPPLNTPTSVVPEGSEPPPRLARRVVKEKYWKDQARKVG